ncbi:hypothetical protein EsHS_00007086 [Epichloe bromicola]
MRFVLFVSAMASAAFAAPLDGSDLVIHEGDVWNIEKGLPIRNVEDNAEVTPTRVPASPSPITQTQTSTTFGTTITTTLCSKQQDYRLGHTYRAAIFPTTTTGPAQRVTCTIGSTNTRTVKSGAAPAVNAFFISNIMPTRIMSTRDRAVASAKSMLSAGAAAPINSLAPTK